MSFKPGEGLYAELGDDGKLKDPIYTKESGVEKDTFKETGYGLSPEQKASIESGGGVGGSVAQKHRSPSTRLKTIRPKDSPSPVLSVKESVPEPVFKPPIANKGMEEHPSYINAFNREVERYNSDLERYENQFSRTNTGFKPGEPVYLELGRDGAPRNDLLVIGGSGKLERSGFTIDAKGFFEDVEEEAKKRDSWLSESLPIKKDDSNKSFFGKREPGKETISTTPTYNVFEDVMKKDDAKLSVTQKAEYLIAKTMPRYWGITKQEYLDRIYDVGSLASFSYDLGQKASNTLKDINRDYAISRDDRLISARSEVTPITGFFNLIGKKEPVNYERSWLNLTESSRYAGVKFVTTTSDVFIAQTLKDPVRDVGLFLVGAGVGKATKLSKIVFKPLSTTIGQSSMFARSAFKGVGIGLKTSAVGVIGGVVVSDIAKSEDKTKRATEIAKDFMLFRAGYKTGFGSPKTTTTKVSKPTKDFPKGYNKVSVDFYPKSSMAVKSGKSPMSKASIRRQSRGLPQKGKKVETFYEPRGKETNFQNYKVLEKNIFGDTIGKPGHITVGKTQDVGVVRKGVSKGQTTFLEIKKPTKGYKSIFEKDSLTNTKISTRGSKVGGLELKKFNVGMSPEVNKRTEILFKIKPIQRGVKLEGSSEVSSKNNIRFSQRDFRGKNFKELVSYEYQSGSGVLLQEQKTRQLLSVNIKQLSKAKPLSIKPQFGEVYNKQQFNLNKGVAPSNQQPSTPLTVSETIGKPQGRDKVVQKILDKAKLKAQQRLVEVKPSIQRETTQPKKINEVVSENPFNSFLNKKKPPLVTVEYEQVPKTIAQAETIVKTTTNTITPTLKKTNDKSSLLFFTATGLKSVFSSSLKNNVDTSIKQNTIFLTSSNNKQDNFLKTEIKSSVDLKPAQSIKTVSSITPTTITPVIRTTQNQPPRNITPSQPVQFTPRPVQPQTPMPLQPKPVKPEIPIKIIPPVIPKLNFSKTPNSSISKPGFSLLVKSLGVFSSKGLFATPREAFIRGSEIVGGTASASFKIKDSSGRVVSPFGLGERFRMSKKDKGVIVERRRYRIDSPGELEEITFKGLATQKKKRGRNFAFF